MKNTSEEDEKAKAATERAKEIMKKGEEYDNAHKTEREKQMDKNAQANSEINGEESLA